MLAHAGEELLIPAAVVMLVLLVPIVRRRARRSFEETDEAAGSTGSLAHGACVHCGAALTGSDERCPECGFRVRR